MALKPARLQWSDDGALQSLDYGDVYFQRGQGAAESRHVFIQSNRLEERFSGLASGSFRIAELGFGTGLNFLLTLNAWRRCRRGGRLVYAAIEKHPVPREILRDILAAWPELRADGEELLKQYPPLVEGFHTLFFPRDNVRLILLLGDVKTMLPQLTGTFDAWFLDGFTPAKNPDMWGVDIFAQVAARTKKGGTLSTFSSAGHVRAGLKSAGFEVQKVPGFGIKWSMTVAALPGAAGNESAAGGVTVLGAGLGGASAARALAERGVFVTVQDAAATIAAGASGNPFGVLYPRLTAGASPQGDFSAHGFCYARNLLRSLNLPSWRECGVAHIDMTAERERRHRQLAAQGHPADFLTYEDGRGLVLPMAGFVSPPEFCAHLLDHPNITLRMGTRAETLPVNDAVTVVALGCASSGFAQTSFLPLRPVRGQMTMVRATASSARLNRVMCHDGYVTPAVDGLHALGATFQKEPFGSAETRPEDDRDNIAKACANVPGLDFTVADIAGARAGWRATTPDHLPIVGAVDEKIYVTAGFGAHGLNAAPIAGEMIAAEISGDPLPLPLSLANRLVSRRF